MKTRISALILPFLLSTAASAAGRPDISVALPSRTMGTLRVSLSLDLNEEAVGRTTCGQEELGDTGDGESDIRTVKSMTVENAGTLTVNASARPFGSVSHPYAIRAQARRIAPEPYSYAAGVGDDCSAFEGTESALISSQDGWAGWGIEQEIPLDDNGLILRLSVQQARLEIRAVDDSLGGYGAFNGVVHGSIVRLNPNPTGRYHSQSSIEHLTSVPVLIP